MRSGHHIAVLVHARTWDREMAGLLISYLAEHWRDAGHRVTVLRGTKRFVPADLLFIHIDLSVVPDEYLEFASRYPAAVNHRANDIRKSRTSKNLLRPGDAWSGPVIVKSDLNYGGLPELKLGVLGHLRKSEPGRRLLKLLTDKTRILSPLSSWSAYRIYDRLELVPKNYFDDHRVVVERFLPEIEDGLFRLRVYQFLGDRSICRRLSSREPLVKSNNSFSPELIEPHPIVDEWRHELGLDYGKLDYVMHEGRPVLLDANKTNGVSPRSRDPNRDERRKYLAEGIESLFAGDGSN